MELSKELFSTLEKYLRPNTFPVAIKIAQKDLDMPKYRSPLASFGGSRLSVCQAIGLARRWGWLIHYTEEDHICPGSFMFFGHTSVPEDVTEGRRFHYPAYAASEEIGKEIQKHMHSVEKDSIHSLYIAPLEKADFIPDVVLMYGNAAQVVRLIQATVYSDGGAVSSQFIGRGACGSSIIVPYQTGECNVIIPGSGERLFAILEDNELLFSIPNEKFQSVIDGLKETHKRTPSRIPTPFMGMTQQPYFPQPYMDAAEGFDKEFPKKP
ncbi:MAG TPA: DUF169 domain-containing protein [Tissierellaceae bacterium]|nr:DUF169 domain-containing protein [Tissierellaceae bacterium]